MAKLYWEVGKYQAPEVQNKKLYWDIGANANDINGAAYLGGKVVAGAASIGIGAYNLIAGAFDQLAGNTYAAEKRYHENSARAFSDKLDTMYKANGAMKFAGAVAEAVGQFIPTAVISLIPGVGVGLSQGVQFAGYMGMNVEDAYKKTGNLGGKEYAYGALLGGFETALEFVGGKVGGWIGGSKLGTSAINLGKGATKGISTAAAKGGKLAVANTVGGIVKGGATEFTEEFIEAFAEVGLQRLFQIDPSATVTLGEALYAGAVGFASGGLMSGTTSLINTQGMKNVGRRVIKAGEADATVAAAFEVASAFKSQGSTEAKVLQTLTDNLTLWEQTADKTGAQAQMLLGNIELSMNVVAAMAASQGTIGTIMKNPEKFLPYAKAIFGEGVTLEDLKNADSRVVRYLAASNWATGEVDALTIRAKRRAFEQSIAAERGGEGILDLSQYSVGEGDTVHRAPDGSYVFTVHNKGDTYTVMHGSDLDHLSALEENGSTAMNKDGAMRAAAAIYRDTWQKAEARAKEEQSKAAVEDGKEKRKSLPEKYAERLDAWDGETIGFSFVLCTTNGILKDIEIDGETVGVKQIRLDASKVKKILSEHGGMSLSVLKRLPDIIKNPVLILSSRSVKGRLVMFGEVTDANGKPVLVALELKPTTKTGKHSYADITKVVSAYGKDGLQNFIEKSEIKYVDKNRNRVDNWLKVNRLQLPLLSPQRDPVPTNRIPQNDENVNSPDEKNTKKYAIGEDAEKTGESATEEKTATDGGETEENAAGEKNAGENGKKHVLSSELKRERERLIDQYGAEVQDKARKLLGKEVDTLSADRRIAIYEAISQGENVDVDILRAACYFMTKRAGLYVYFGQDLNEVIERETTEETDSEQSAKKRVRKNGLHKVLSAGARLVALDGSAKSLRRVLVHEIFHDIAPTKKGRKLMMTALEVSSAQRLYGISKLYGDHFAATYHERGVVSFEQFCKDGKYDVESKESVLSAIEAYENKYEAVIGKNALVEEIAAEVVGHNLDSKRFMKMVRDTNAGGLILRGLRRMLTYLRTKKEARPLYLEAVRFENLYLDAVGERATLDSGTRLALDYAESIDKIDSGVFDTQQNTHLNVLDYTPQIYIEKAGAKNHKILMAWDIAYLAMKKEGEIPGHYHGLGADVMKALPGALEDPLFIVKQENGRIAAVTKIVVKGKRAVFASIELDAFKTTIQEGTTESQNVNLVLTVTDAKPNYLQNTIFSGEIVHNKNNEDPAHFILRLKSLKEALPTYDLAGSSTISIPQNTEMSTPKAQENAPISKNSLSYDEHELNPPKTSEGEKRKNIAHHTRAKSYKQMEAAEVVRVMFSSERFGAKGAILSMKGASKKAIIDYLWRQMNTTDPDKFDEIAERVADFMIRHTTLQEAFITPSDEVRFENARIALDVITRFKGKIHISEQARAELVYRFGGKNGRKKGEGDKLSDYWHQKDGNGMSVEMAAEAIETAIRDNGGYCDIVADTVQETIYNLSQFYGEALRDMEDYRTYMQKTSMEAESEADRNAFRAEIKEKIMDALRDKGKESKYHKFVQFYERENERLRDRLWESNKKYEGAVKVQYGAAHAVFLAREMADIVKKRKYVNAADVISPEMEAVGEILSKIATPRKIKDKDAREAMGLLARWYTPQNVDGDSATEQGEAAEGSLYHPEIKEKMERLAAGDKNAQLTYEELREMAQVLGAVRHVILNYGTVVLEGHRVQAAQLATDETSLLVSYLEKGEGKEGKGFLSSIFHNAGAAVGKKLKDNFLYKIMTPKQVIQSLEWFDKDGVLTRCFADMQNGMAGAGSDYADMMRPVMEFLDAHKKYEKRLSKEYISYEGEEMSVGQAISLYLTTKREQAALGFEEAGFRYMGKDGKVRQAAPRPAEAIRGEISAALSADDKAYIKVVEDVFARAGEMKKQTDLEIFGFTNVENGYYYPIARDQMEIARKVSDLRATLREMAVVGNKSFNKSTVKGAKNALFISDVTLVTNAHAMGVSQYANLYMPFSTWDRLWNKKVDDGKGGKISVRQLIGDRIWTGKNDRSMADGFFRQLFADMQGVRADKRTGDSFYETLRSTYVSAALGFNLSSILKQTGSFASAMVYLHPVDLAKGLGMNLKTDRAEMWKYSKVANARMFQRGRFVEQNANTKLESMGKGVREFGEMTMIGVEGMDNMVIGRLWNACQQNIARTKGLAVGTEQNKVEAGKLLDTVINETQSTSTADTRSALQRGGFIGKTLSMFSSDAVKQVSYLFEGAARVYCARLRRKMGKGSDAEVKAANVFLGRAVASFAASTALVVAITQFIKWLLGREREEDETVVEDVTHEAIGQVLGIIPLVSDVYGKVANNYDIDDFSFEAINGLLEGTVTLTSNVVKAANGEIVSRQEILKPLRTVIYQAGAFTGLPIRNFTNYTTGVLKKLSPKAGYSFDALFEKPSYTADISKAIERGDTKLAEYILELSVRERMGKGDYDSVVAAELLNLNLNGFAAPDDSVTPPSIPASVGDVAVNAAQYKQMQRIYNKASGALAQMVQSDSYLALSDEEKVDAVNRVYRTYLNLAKAEVMGADRTAAVWVSPLLSGESGAILAHIATMESDDESTRSEKVTDYLSTLDLGTEEKYLILFAAGYRSKAVLASVRKSMAKSDFSDELKKQFTEEYPEK